MEETKKVKLSKAILDMKFMKKSKERVEKEDDDAEGYAMYSSEISEEMRRCGTTIFVPARIAQCKDLLDGRFSFGGMNPEVEKIMSDQYTKMLEEVERQKEKDITDAELASGYSTLVDTMGKKFKPKRTKKAYNHQFSLCRSPQGERNAPSTSS